MTFKGTIGLIGARGGSKRIINKNIKLLGDFPLLTYSIFVSRASYFIDKTYVSTDSNEIAKIAFNYEANVVMRPSEYATDNSTDIEWISHFLGEYVKNNRIYPENIVFLRPTSPFRAVSEVDKAISLFEPQNTSLRSVEPIPEAIEKTFRMTDERLLVPAYPNLSLKDTNNPNHFFPLSLKANGYVDIIKSEYILDTHDLYGDKIQGFMTLPTIEIDTEEQWGLAELHIKELYGLHPLKD